MDARKPLKSVRNPAASRQLRAKSGSGIGGSAVVALLAAGSRFACTWAGDSRYYGFLPVLSRISLS